MVYFITMKGDTVTKKLNKPQHEIIMIFTAFVLLTAATILSIINDNDIPTIIPFHTITVPIINGLSAFACFILFFIKTNIPIQCGILFVQGICTSLTGYEVLGAFLYSSMLIILFCDGYFVTNAKRKITFFIIFWIITVLSLLPFSLQRFILELLVSAFFAGFYSHIYKKLESHLSVFIPFHTGIENMMNLPERGSEINLQDFKLTERQIILLKEYMEHRTSYKDMAEKYILSLSTVKKEMACICSAFKVKNMQDLYFILSQYVIL